jgi:hypothetical protein
MLEKEGTMTRAVQDWISHAIAHLNAAVAHPARMDLELRQAESYIHAIRHRPSQTYLMHAVEDIRANAHDTIELRRIVDRVNDWASIPTSFWRE